jgi:hypothetical protein
MSVEGGLRQVLVRVVQGVVLAVAVAGVVVTADGRNPDDIGTVAALVGAAVLITWQFRRIWKLRPFRDELLAKQVERNAATAEEALRKAERCERRTAELAALMAAAARAAEIASPDIDATQPRLRSIGNLEGQPQALAV